MRALVDTTQRKNESKQSKKKQKKETLVLGPFSKH